MSLYYDIFVNLTVKKYNNYIMSNEFDGIMKDQLLSDILEDGAEIFPIMTEEDELENENEILPDTLPILPLRNTVLFPGVVMPVSVGREKSLKLIREVYRDKGYLGCVTQREAEVEEPVLTDMYETGTAAKILKVLEMPDGSTTVILQGRRRIELEDILFDEPYHVGKVHAIKEVKAPANDREFEALAASLKDMALKVIKYSAHIPKEAGFAIKNIESSFFLINFISSNTEIDYKEKQSLLEINDAKERALRLLEILVKEVQMLELKNDLQKKVKVDIDKQQREYFLHQQMKTIQDELGGNPVDQDIEDLREEAKDKKWSDEIAEQFDKELTKLGRLNPAAPDYSIQMNYLKEVIDLPWNEYTEDNFDLKHAQKVLDSDHYGLEKVKERIMEYLAVLKLKGDLKSPIICLYGPPGVGKTSLGKSIATSLNREYVRMSLGGLHDESEIRGHRKTYIGAMPGRIMRNMKKAGSANPVFILDEIDKVGSDFRGDPQSALLEVLDPEQNNSFHDNYIDMDFDLSKVIFIATANDISNIAPALRDRMEMIDISGYLMEEKVEIAKRHLIPKQLENHGLEDYNIKIGKPVIESIVEKYTRESGVRTLDKTIAKLVRQIAKKIALEEDFSNEVSKNDLKEYLGIEIFSREEYQGNDFAGVVTGLAWTSVGGEILFVESSLSKGKGGLTLTGNLGAVMKESATIALEYIKSNADSLEIDEKVFENYNIHIHVPEGATPKDGPSAGITMATSLASSLTQRKIKKHIAMTGEITLRGKVLPVGGIKEKILAAKRAGIKEIILCKENQKNIEDIKEKYIKGLTFHYVENVMDVLDIALLKQKVKNPIKF